jgi:outer membrane protein assembly factor BamB
MTCIAVSTIDSTKGKIFAGSWDKDIYAFDLSSTPNTASKTGAVALKGHTDFIKTLLPIPNREILISGSADASIIIWNTATNTIISKLAIHTRGVQALAYGGVSALNTPMFFSGDSTGEIRAWDMTSNPKDTKEIALPLSGTKTEDETDVILPLSVQHTSIYDLEFLDSGEEGELWSASADKTAVSIDIETGRVDTTLTHPDFVKCVAVVPNLGIVATGCRDGNIRIWSVATGELLHELKGHFEEITDLLLAGQEIVSVSIDGTLRRWNLAGDYLANSAKAGEEMEQKGWKEEEKPKKSKGVELTAEEEAELAELMSDEDD